jgi:hypothetical protein
MKLGLVVTDTLLLPLHRWNRWKKWILGLLLPLPVVSVMS